MQPVVRLNVQARQHAPLQQQTFSVFSPWLFWGKKIPKSHTLGEGTACCVQALGRFKICMARAGFPHLCCPFSRQWLMCVGAVLGSTEGSTWRLEITGQSPLVFLPGQRNLGCEWIRSYSCPRQVMISQKEEKWQLDCQAFAAMCSDL